MKLTTLLASACLFTLAFTACATFQEGSTVAKFEPDVGPVMTETAVAGNYALFDSQELTPKMSVPLPAGAAIGFKDGPDGTIIAVYGDKTWTLANRTRSHYWRHVKD